MLATHELIVVGVDGSPRSVDALVWALRHALEEDRPVLVATAWPLKHRAFVREVPGHFNDARWEAREAQARAIAKARSLVADAPQVETALVNASLLEAIIALATPDRLVVLGTDRTEQDGPGLSSRSRHAAAPGPVLVVPAPAAGEHR